MTSYFCSTRFLSFSLFSIKIFSFSFSLLTEKAGVEDTTDEELDEFATKQGHTFHTYVRLNTRFFCLFLFGIEDFKFALQLVYFRLHCLNTSRHFTDFPLNENLLFGRS